MRMLKPPAVYINQTVLKNRQAKERLDRMMGKIETPKVETLNDEQMDEIIEQNRWRSSRRLTGKRREGDPAVVFDTYRWAPKDWIEGELPPRKFRNVMLGTWNHRRREHIAQKDGVVCQSGYGLHSAKGCLFKCDYCAFEDVLVLATDIEDFLQRVDPIIRSVAGPTLWKWDNGSDTLCFEPEMGAAKLLVEYFAQFEDKFLMTYSKSDNVDHLLNLDHKGQTICCWTLNAYTQSRLIERDAATMEERIEAAYKCEQAGYNVRFRFSAVCPVHNWQQENREMLDLLFSKVHPDVISLETLSRFPDPAIFDRVMDASLFEPRFVQAIREGSEEMRGKIWGPIPDEQREEIYRFLIGEIRRRSPDTPVSLCQEPISMWKRLSDVLDMSPDYYACCCAKDSVPGGHPRISRLEAR
jgi:spore photoproduct lyase